MEWHPLHGPKSLFKFGEKGPIVCYCTHEQKMNFEGFTQNSKILVNVLRGGVWLYLKRERDIGRKVMLSDVKTAFRCTPP